jgi:transposase
MYPIDRRKIAVHIYSLLSSLRKTAILLDVGHTTIARWLKAPSRVPYKRRNQLLKSQLVVEIIETAIKCDPFVSTRGLVLKIKAILNIDVSRELVRVVIKRMGVTKKKARYYGVSKDQNAKKEEFLKQRDLFLDQRCNFVSIDETSFGRNGINTMGYTKKGTKLHICKKPQRCITTSAVCCVSSIGIEALAIRQGSFNTSTFMDFISSLRLPRGTIVLMDNVSFHKSASVRSAILEKGLVALYTPPYSPWFNPIEMCFSIVKRSYYKSLDIHSAFRTLTRGHAEAFFNKSLKCAGPF